MLRLCLFFCLTLFCSFSFASNCAHLNILVDQVEKIELNHYYNMSGEHAFDQIILWEYNYEQARFEVRTFIMARSQKGILHKNWDADTYSYIWHDGSRLRKIVGKTYMESWTTVDPEIENRKTLPMSMRKGLTNAFINTHKGIISDTPVINGPNAMP